MAFDTSKDTNQIRMNDPHNHSLTEADKLGDHAHDDLSADPDLEGLTLYEKKALLVNRELDRQGMGRCKPLTHPLLHSAVSGY
jgi:hypothetical protein